MLNALPYRYIVVADFEFEFGGHASTDDAGRSGERPRPVCMVAKELRSGQEWRLWRGQFGSRPPFPIGPDALFIAYYASAELGCFRALGWHRPANVLDLYTEFRDRTNGLTTPAGSGLVGALTYFGLDNLGATEKDEMRALVLRGEPWSESERKAILDYCATDIDALERLLPQMLPPLSNHGIDLPRALVRGRFIAAAAAMEWNGVPIDVPTLELFREHWTEIQDDLIRDMDTQGIFEGRTFKADRWANFLTRNNIPWPLLESGSLDLSPETFRQMAKSYSSVSAYRELRSSLSELRLNDLAVGHDGRNRTILSAFRARTSRNQPSNTRFIFGPSVWLRGLIKPSPGYGVAYVDWSQQEFGIAAALSGDEAMQEAYLSGDCYLTFAKQAGAVPQDATKCSHKEKREQFKRCVLGVQYGMGEKFLASWIGQPTIVGRDLLHAHHQTYRKFWRWSDAVVDHAMIHGSLHTVLGWHIHIGDDKPNPRSLRNFPMQANGAELLRLACCLATERGVQVCAPIHDAVLICSPLERLDEDIVKMRSAMVEASRIVLGGFELRTDCPDEFDEHGKPNEFPHIIRYPRRYMDSRGVVMWDKVTHLISERQLKTNKRRRSHG
jgi:DNA polymerase I